MYQTLLFFIQRTPFFFPFLGLCLGILLQGYAHQSSNIAWITGGLGLVFLLGFFLLPHRKRYHWQTVLSVAYCLLFITGGQVLLAETDIRNHKNWIGKLEIDTLAPALELVIETSPVEKTNTTQVIASVCALHRGKSPQPAVGKIILSSYQSESLAHLLPGTRILLIKIPNRLIHTGNPGERDWATYYLRQQITHRCMVKNSDFLLLDSSTYHYVFTRLLIQVQRKIVSLLESSIQDPQAAGLAAALLIGYREQLDSTLQESYSKTGVIHIIAISGMHLALLGWLLQFFVRPFQKNKIRLVLSQFLIIAIIWFFTLLAGATPSVLRAALAFTIDAVGKMLARKPLSINTLTAAGFLLLVAQPYWLWDLGFQLSFSAVLSIVLFAKPIQQVLITRIQFLQSVTTLIAVTLAAQLLTSPFTLYYFQQFPLGFLLSNLVAVPLSTCILYILLLLLLTASIPFVGTGVGMVAKITIGWMNQYIRLISEIPGIQLDELHWTWGEAFLLLIVILTGAGCLLLKCKSSTLLTVIGGCLLITWQCCDYFLHQKQKALIIYQSKSNTIISWINGNQALHILDSNGRAKVVKKNRLIKASNSYYRIQRQTDTLLTPYFQVGNWTIIVPNRKFEPPTITGREKETILLISKAAPYYGSSWVQNQTITIAILDGTLGVRTRANWKKLFNARGIPVHDMLTAGAFVHSSSSSTFALLSTLHTP